MIEKSPRICIQHFLGTSNAIINEKTPNEDENEKKKPPIEHKNSLRSHYLKNVCRKAKLKNSKN